MKSEKKIGAEIGMGYCPIVLQKERILYCNTVIVLQESVLQPCNCIARDRREGCGIVLQDGCSWLRTVLQYSYCIAT